MKTDSATDKKHTDHATDKKSGAPPIPTNAETHGQGILARVEARQKEFAAKLAKTPNDPARDPSHAGAIEAALAAIKGLMTGDLKNISSQTAAEMSLWLESSKHLSDEKAEGTKVAKA